MFTKYTFIKGIKLDYATFFKSDPRHLFLQFVVFLVGENLYMHSCFMSVMGFDPIHIFNTPTFSVLAQSYCSISQAAVVLRR